MTIEYKYQLRKPKLPVADEIYPYLKRIDSSRWYSNFGPLISEFEAKLAEHFHTDTDNVLLVSNATIGLYLALESLDFLPDSYCAIPAATFPATAEAVILSGLKPIFVDIDSDSLTLCENKIKSLKARLGSKLAAIVPVSFFGKPLDQKKWLELSDELNVSCICDSAWSFDSLIISPLINVLSLHATKPFGIGEGGLIVCEDPAKIRKMKIRSNFGIGADRDILISGINGKMSEYAAAVGLAALEQWPKKRSCIEKITKNYISGLRAVDGVDILPDGSDNWVSGTICIRCHDIDTIALINYLNQYGIEARFWWGKLNHKLSAFDAIETDDQKCAVELYNSCFNLPFDEEMQEDDIDFIVNAVREGVRTLS